MGNDRLRPVDEAILDALIAGKDAGEPWGRDTTGRLAEATGYSTQHIINRINVLEAAGLIRQLDRGVYEITADGVERSV